MIYRSADRAAQPAPGHAAGDLVLQRAGAALQAEMFSLADDAGGSRVGRLGGEEFIVVWTNVGEDDVTAHALRLLDRIRALRFPDIDPALAITDTSPARSFLAEANRLLYVAKRNGRDRIVLAKPENAALAGG